METLHIKGFANELDINEFFSDNYNHDLRFTFEEESEDTMENIFLRIYVCPKECSLEEALENQVKKMSGCLSAIGEEYGYSEYTIEGFNVRSLKLGGHDIDDIIKGFGHYYLHILIDQVNLV